VVDASEGAEDEAVDVDGLFLPMDRTATRRLERAESLIRDEHFGEAVLLLDAILNRGEDSFFRPTRSRSSYRSLKTEARRLIGQLPREGRAIYELEFGTRARKLLEQATAAGDLEAIAQVSRRYFHTEAGYEATLLVGFSYLDHGRPLAAALRFDELLAIPAARRRFGSTLPVLVAATWQRAGRPDRARDALLGWKRRSPAATVRVAGAPHAIFGGARQALQWLDAIIGPQQPNGPDRGSDWVVYGGNAARDQRSNGGQPMLAARWRVRTAIHPAVEKLVDQMRHAYLARNMVSIPGLYPLAVGDLVLMRTVRRLVAVDFRTGKRVWDVGPEADDPLDRLINAGEGRRAGDRNLQLGLGLQQRMWEDRTYGILSSDGRRVFSIEGLELLDGMSNQAVIFMGMGRRRLARGIDRAARNRLCAFSLAEKGRLVWENGGPDGVEPAMAEAFFLGAPLVVGKELYALAEIKSGMRLVVFDAETGRQQWSQQLVDLEQSVAHDPLRRLAGVSPSLADGVLVCPTSAGTVVAVDLARRSLLWAYRYAQRDNGRDSRTAMIVHGRGRMRSRNHWIDPVAMLANGHVLLTPLESDRLHCLNLVDGKVLWTRKRGDDLYVAGVDHGHVILIGNNQINALRLVDGSPVWSEPGKLPAGSHPSGRGYLSDGRYYLPLSSAEVATIDLREGRIVARAKSRDGRIPGNLICHRDQVISQGVDSADAFYQVEPLRRRVQQALANNPDDAEALARQGELAFNEGDLASARVSFERSFDLVRDELTRELLVRTLLDALRRDFTAHQEAVVELERLIDQPEQRVTLLRLVARGFAQTNQVSAAFDAYLKLIDADAQADDLLEVAPGRSVRADRFIRAQLRRLREVAASDARGPMDRAVAQRLADLQGGANPDDRRRFLAFFGDFPQADQVRMALAQALLEDGPSLECEVHLRVLEKSHDPQIAHAATAMIARMLRAAKRPSDARPYFAKLAGPLRGVVCLDGKTGQDIFDALPADDPLRQVAPASRAWPVGAVQIETIAPRRTTLMRRRTTLRIAGNRGPFFRDLSLMLDQQGTPAIVGIDGYGGARFRIPLSAASPRTYLANANYAYGAVDGHLLVLSMGLHVVAIDTLQEAKPPWKNVLWSRQLDSVVPGIARVNSLRARRINIPGRLPRYRAEDGRGRPVGLLGPILETGITLLRSDEVICIDPRSGETVWTHRGVSAGSELFGDQKRLFVVPPSRGASTVEAVVLDPLDGSPIGTRRIAPARRAHHHRIATLGSRTLEWAQADAAMELALRDPWKQTTIWSHRFSERAQIWLLDNDMAGIMEPSGHFVLVRLADGAKQIDHMLTPEPQLEKIYLLRSREQILLITSQPPPRDRKRHRVSPVPGGFDDPLITGRLYAFDRHSGAQQWPVPVILRRRGVRLSQPADLPVLTLVQQVIRPERSSQRTTLSVLCLDKRTGRPLLDLSDLPRGSGVFRVGGDPADQTVTLTLPGKRLTMKFTGQPLPPEPPLQDDADAAADRRTGLHILGAIPRSLIKAAAAAAGGDPFSSPQSADHPAEDPDDDD